MSLETQPYFEQKLLWPRSGRHILAQFDAESVIVYQAYRVSIGKFAVENGFFGGDFSYSRMSWIKPNGGKLERRARQLGLRDEALGRFGKEQLMEVLDLTEFVGEQRALLQADRLAVLTTPRERFYRPIDPVIANRLRLSRELPLSNS